MDESTKHDSACIIECIALVIERVKAISVETGKPFPSTILVASDNTVREAKNQFLMAYLSNIVARGLVTCSGLLNLRKSHTHDQVDQLWGILARRIASADSFQNPEEVIAILAAECQRPGLKSWIGANTEVLVRKLDAVHEWRTHFAPQKVVLSGGLKEDASGNHCFLLLKRKGEV